MLKIQNIQQNWNQEYGHKKAKKELQVSKIMLCYHQAPCSGWIITSIYACWSSSKGNLSHDSKAFKSKKTLATCKNLCCFLKDMVLIGVIWNSSSIDCIALLQLVVGGMEKVVTHFLVC